MKGLILAAGRGTRFRPLTDKIPKALIPVCSRPMLEYLFDDYAKTEITEIGIVVLPEHEPMFRRAIKGNTRFKFTIILQKETQGTAKAVELAKDFIGTDSFLLVWCDFLTFFDFNKIIGRHKKYGDVMATVLLNKGDKPQKTGVVEFKGQYITRMVEKPEKAFSVYGSAGLLVVEAKVLEHIKFLKPAAQGEYHIGDAFQLMINEGYKVGYKVIDTWRINVNAPEDLEVAEKYIRRYCK